MNARSLLAVAATCLLLAGCASQPPATPAPVATTATHHGNDVTVNVASRARDKANQDQLARVMHGVDMIEHGQIQQAIDGPLDEVIADYEKTWAHSDKIVFSAHDTERSLVYLLGVAALADKSGKPPYDAIDVGPAWSMAYWAEGYAYNALGQYTRARVELGKALALAPMNSQYKSELAFSYLKTRDWAKALGLYQDAAGYAGLAPEENRTHLKCVALRGQGYVLVELHRLDDAVKAYEECLKLNPNDAKSRGELRYIRGLGWKPHPPLQDGKPSDHPRLR